MRTDYKFWYVRRGDGTILDGVEQADGIIEEVAVRWYEGDITTQLEQGQPVTRYRRTRRLTPTDLAHLGARPTVVESSGGWCALYTADDFGTTRDLDDVRAVLNAATATDPIRTPVEAQRVTASDRIRLNRIVSMR